MKKSKCIKVQVSKTDISNFSVDEMQFDPFWATLLEKPVKNQKKNTCK